MPISTSVPSFYLSLYFPMKKVADSQRPENGNEHWGSRHVNTRWPKKVNFTRWQNYHGMQATPVCVQYHTFLIKCINDNKMEKVMLKIDKIPMLYRPITKIRDHFIVDWHTQSNWLIFFFLSKTQYPIHNFFTSYL